MTTNYSSSITLVEALQLLRRHYLNGTIAPILSSLPGQPRLQVLQYLIIAEMEGKTLKPNVLDRGWIVEISLTGVSKIEFKTLHGAQLL